MALREKQLREQRYAHLNGIKIHNQWRKIMRMAKVEELRKEIEILSQNHEREVDRKDAIMQMLDRDLEEAEEQYTLSVRSHMTILDQLLDLQYSRMKVSPGGGGGAAAMRVGGRGWRCGAVTLCTASARQAQQGLRLRERRPLRAHVMMTMMVMAVHGNKSMLRGAWGWGYVGTKPHRPA